MTVTGLYDRVRRGADPRGTGGHRPVGQDVVLVAARKAC